LVLQALIEGLLLALHLHKLRYEMNASRKKTKNQLCEEGIMGRIISSVKIDNV